MFIRYHLFFYAVGCILIILSRILHPLFYIFFIMYIFYISYRLNHRHTIMVILLSLLLLNIPTHQEIKLDNRMSGIVVKLSEKYCFVKTSETIIKLYHDEELSYQDRIECIIEEIELNDNRNDNAFNERLYLYSQKVYNKAIMKVLISKKSSHSLYHFIESRLSSNKDIENYQRLFLFGEKSDDIQEDYQHLSQLSIVHLFALSGMHIHILCFILKKLFCLVLNPKLSLWLSYLCIGVYVFSIPMQVSLYRAFFVLILYELFKRWFHQLDILSFLVIISLFYNPYIIYNISFVFSYFIYFIVLITKNLKYSSLLIYGSSIPIVLSLNYQVPFAAFFLSLLMTPFIELLYGLCVFSVFIPYLNYLISICINILRMIISFIDFCNTFFVFSKPELSFIVMFYILFFVIIYRLTLNKKVFKNVLMLFCFMISFFFYSTYKIYGEITMIDVGQGDCTLIRLPMNRGNILIDTGGNKDYDLATHTIIPYLKSIGIHSLDYVYISHSDFDHSGALESLSQNFKIGQIINDYEEYREIGNMKITMLKTENHYSDVNDQSLIMKVDIEDFSILFTGDISINVEKELKDKYQKLDIDILKVSHHGSATSSSTSLFNLIQPEVAMIGVKENNLYRHPSIEVIERLERKNIKILRTDLDGMFHIRFYGKSRYIFR